MSYTVKELAEISGVSIRTLHWYDEIDLLKPAYIGANGYRYYEQGELLTLQQILFFRKLGIPLKKIQKVLGGNRFDKIQALLSHRELLVKTVDRSKELIETIDKTINHIKGKIQMKDNEFYTGFDAAKQEEYEQYLVKHLGSIAEDLIHEFKEKTMGWSLANWKKVHEDGEEIYKELSKCMDQGCNSKDDQVQVLIARHFQLMERFYTVSKDVYIGLSQLYADHPDFRKEFERHHPKLVEFMGEAMRFFAYHNL